MVEALTSWDIASLAFKLLWYLGFIAALGGTVTGWVLIDSSRQTVRRGVLYSLCGSLLGFHAVIFYFLAQVGAASGSGITGALDWTMIQFFLNLGVGETSLFRMAVFLLLALGQIGTLSYLARLTQPPGQSFYRLYYRLNAAALLALLLSFQSTGHVATLPLLARIALVLHVLGVTLWLGSLWPLYKATRQFELVHLETLMRSFSRRATIMVGVLLVAAIFLLTQLLASPAELITTGYGISLIIKLVLVGALLGLASHNRWRLVPQLSTPAAAVSLRRSIGLEIVIGGLILIVTVYLSTVIGPPAHS